MVFTMLELKYITPLYVDDTIKYKCLIKIFNKVLSSSRPIIGLDTLTQRNATSEILQMFKYAKRLVFLLRQKKLCHTIPIILPQYVNRTIKPYIQVFTHTPSV